MIEASSHGQVVITIEVEPIVQSLRAEVVRLSFVPAVARLASPVLRAARGGRIQAENSRVKPEEFPASVLERETGFEPATLSLGGSRTQSATSPSRRSRSQTPIISGPRTVPIPRATSIPSQLAQRFPLVVLRRCCGRRRHRGTPQRRLGARMEARAACSPCAPWRPGWASPRPLSTRWWRRERYSTSVSPTPSESPLQTWMRRGPARGSEPRLDSSIDPMNSSNSRSSFRRQRRFLATADHDRHSPPGT